MILKRIIFDLIILFILFILFPWWVSVIFAFAGLFYFERFYEAVIVGLLIDSIYGSFIILPNFPYFMTTCFFIITILIIRFKKNLIMY
jgi:hypothetical protein